MQKGSYQLSKERLSLIAVIGIVASFGLAPAALGQDAGATGGKVKNGLPEKSDNRKANNGKTFSGNISWYGAQFQGLKTASGERFDMNKLTAAHRKLPFSAKVLVENPKTGKSVIVKVNDRGPYVRTRVMDVSREGARRLGSVLSGIFYGDCLVLDEDDS